MAKVVIFGVGDFAGVAYVYLTHDSNHEVVAFTVDRDYLKESEFFELPVVAWDKVEKSYPPDEFKMFILTSFKRMNHFREDKYNQAKDKGYQLISYVSSKATIWPNVIIGDNCCITEGNLINPFVEIGNDVVLWNGNHVGHHTIIKDHCFITSHVVICGRVVIEPYCFLGVNSTIRDEAIIAKETLVGAGALIMEDTKEYAVYRGFAAESLGIRSDELRSISHKAGG